MEPIAALLDDKAPPVQALAFSSVFHALLLILCQVALLFLLIVQI